MCNNKSFPALKLKKNLIPVVFSFNIFTRRLLQPRSHDNLHVEVPSSRTKSFYHKKNLQYLNWSLCT